MPRLPKPPVDFIIEGLSTGEREHSLRTPNSDWDGMAIERAPLAPRRGNAPMLTPHDIMALNQQRKQAEYDKALKRAQRTADAVAKAITDMIDPPPFKPFKRRF